MEMAQEVTLVADVNRGTGKSAARKIRREGKVPAVVYGLGTDPEPVAVPSRELQHSLHGTGGANTRISLDLGGRQELALGRPGVPPPGRLTDARLDLHRGGLGQAVSG